MNRCLILFSLWTVIGTMYGDLYSLSLPPQSQLKDGNFESSDDSSSGNWYEKLHWWREAKRLYTSDIQAAIEQLKAIAKSYEEKKKAFFTQLETSLKTLSVPAPQAVPRIKLLLQELAAKKEQEPDESETITENSKKLEAVHQAFEQLSVLSRRLEDAYNKVLISQIKMGEQYEEKALENFEKIENVFDDQKAHGYYLIVENSLENLKAVITYLTGPLYSFTEQVGMRVLQTIPRIKASVEALEKEGIYVRILSEAENAQRAAAERKTEEARAQREAAKKAEALKKATPWWRAIVGSITSFFSNLWESIMSLFRSSPPVAKKGPQIPPKNTPVSATATQKTAQPPASAVAVPVRPAPVVPPVVPGKAVPTFR
ncbi:hypothetical protein H0X06_05235 [Candidatus Dependentiae bacterium]|nr:hypothetical protein [Candidatus Dependentiae bacterium]